MFLRKQINSEARLAFDGKQNITSLKTCHRHETERKNCLRKNFVKSFSFPPSPKIAKNRHHVRGSLYQNDCDRARVASRTRCLDFILFVCLFSLCVTALRLVKLSYRNAIVEGGRLGKGYKFVRTNYNPQSRNSSAAALVKIHNTFS